MKEYQAALEEYSSDEYLFFSDLSDEERRNKKIAEEYLKRYWLSKEEYEIVWKPIQNSIFKKQDSSLPEMIFTKPYNIISLRGSACLFDAFSFRQLQECMSALGDKYFVVVQQQRYPDQPIPLLHLKYPVAIRWREFMSGNYISAVMYDAMLFSFLVFGNSGAWGKYIDTDADYYPLELIGVKPKYTDLFKQVFAVSETEEREVWNYIPDNYKKRLVSTIESPKSTISPEVEYQNIMDYYSDVRYSSFALRHISEAEWNNKKGAQEYLQQYWLPSEEYETIWKPIQDVIFINQDKGIDDIIFANEYNIIALLNDYLFTKESLEQLKKCLRAIDDTYFVVIESNQGGFLRQPLLRLKYPTNISWNELRADNFISAILCSKFNKYFVFGLSSFWGKYVALGFNLLGFKPEYSHLFKEVFSVPAKEEEETHNHIHLRAYKNRLVSTSK